MVRVKEKFQVTLPASVRQKTGLAVGDLLEANVEGKTITLTPKAVIDRELALALADVKKGRVYGPFRSAKEMLRSLRGGRKRKPAP